MKILLAADGSSYTTKAVDYLVSHFNWFKEGPELHVFHVKAPISDGLARSLVGNAVLESYYKEESEAALAPAEKLLQKHQLTFKSSYAVGEVSEEIQAYVKKHKIDLVVMGSHGHGAIKQLIMGSIATRVLATSSVPVLLVR